MFEYHPIEVEVEVPIEEIPVTGFNTTGTTDFASDAAWLPGARADDADFQYHPEGKHLEFKDPESLRRYIGSLVRTLTDIVMDRPYEPCRSSKT